MDRNNKVPCCAADAMRRIRQVNVEGIIVGIAMLDSIIREVIALNLQNDRDVETELIKRVKIYNYVPKSAEEAYAAALLREYKGR
jgi:hypothetical protein